FFQAEDGIRDLTVTGVQTCALPISPGAPRDRSCRISPATGEPSPGASPSRSGARRSAERPVSAAMQERGEAGPAQTREAGPASKIGRASCRERGEVAGGGGGVRKRK